MSDSVIQLSDYHIRSDTGRIYFTYSDIQNMPEWPDSSLLEIIKGDLYVVPSPSINHQRVERNLSYILQTYLKQHEIGEILSAPVDVRLSEESVVIPDIVFISSKNKNIIKKNYIDGVPDLLVEILSANKKRDLVDKKSIYESYGVKEYLIVDIEGKIIIQYSGNNNRKFSKVQNYTDIIKIHSLNNFSIKLEEIFSF